MLDPLVEKIRKVDLDGCNKIEKDYCLLLLFDNGLSSGARVITSEQWNKEIQNINKPKEVRVLKIDLGEYCLFRSLIGEQIGYFPPLSKTSFFGRLKRFIVATVEKKVMKNV